MGREKERTGIRRGSHPPVPPLHEPSEGTAGSGEDYEGELPNDVTLYIHNTVTEATIDLAVGIPTRNQYASARTVIARDEGNHTYGAILVPQRLLNRLPLLEVVTEGCLT